MSGFCLLPDCYICLCVLQTELRAVCSMSYIECFTLSPPSYYYILLLFGPHGRGFPKIFSIFKIAMITLLLRFSWYLYNPAHSNELWVLSYFLQIYVLMDQIFLYFIFRQQLMIINFNN